MQILKINKFRVLFKFMIIIFSQKIISKILIKRDMRKIMKREIILNKIILNQEILLYNYKIKIFTEEIIAVKAEN